MKIAAVVILFNPDDSVIANILSYSHYFPEVIVVDNSEKNSSVQKQLSEIANCTYFSDGQNQGIAARLNQACSYAISNGYEWLLTMDQDSAFEQPAISNYLTCIRVYNPKNSIAMFGVSYDKIHDSKTNCEAKIVSHLITSGSVLNLILFDEIGPFDEKLFIDQVDFEYCFRAIKKGFSILQLQNIYLLHKLGETSVHRSLVSFKKTKRSLHGPQRIYYMTRNFFYVKALYKSGFPNEIAHSKKDLLNRMKNNLLYNSKRVSVMKAIVQGYIDYKRMRMGKKQD